jgi:hypothetical protein
MLGGPADAGLKAAEIPWRRGRVRGMVARSRDCSILTDLQHPDARRILTKLDSTAIPVGAGRSSQQA